MIGREDEVAVGGRVATRLAQHAQAQRVAMCPEPRHLVEHRRAGDVDDAAGDDTPMLAGGVGVDRMNEVGEVHDVEKSRRRAGA
jgi:hypothetical protein